MEAITEEGRILRIFDVFHRWLGLAAGKHSILRLLWGAFCLEATCQNRTSLCPWMYIQTKWGFHMFLIDSPGSLNVPRFPREMRKLHRHCILPQGLWDPLWPPLHKGRALRSPWRRGDDPRAYKQEEIRQEDWAREVNGVKMCESSWNIWL